MPKTPCPHPITVIDHSADTVKEVCQKCGEVVMSLEDETYRCGSTDTLDGEPCGNVVNGPDETCWRH